MFGIFSRRLSELDDSDLRELVEVRKLREHTHLDYKKQMYEHTWYGSNDNGKKEMLGDITAMANARGGYILIGVEEDETEPDGTPKALVGIPNGDQEARWIEDVCIDSIDEKIAGLQTRAIEISGTASCVVVQVPNSLRKPHMVSRGSYRSFSRRHGQRNAQMDMPEIRSMIISMSQYRESLAYFLVERKEAFARSAGKEPQLLLMATPIYVDRDKVDTSQDDIRGVLKRPPGLQDSNFFGIYSGEPRPRIFGVESAERANSLRLFRNGHLEYSEPITTVPENWPEETALPIRSYRITVLLLQFLETARQILRLAEVSEPIAVALHLVNIGKSYLFRWRRSGPTFWDNIFFWLDQSLDIEVAINDLSDPEEIARHMIDVVFNAYGYDDNPHFDEDGQFTRWC